MKDYMKLIKETIQQHPEIHPAVISDVLCRCRDWMEYEYAQVSDSYLERQYNYLLEWIES